MATWFTADTHFGHGAARGFHRRPFASVSEMDMAMIAAWQAMVAPDDELWHLGDFAVGRQVSSAALLAALPGRKHLVVGNNDSADVTAQPGWTSVQTYAEIVVDSTALVLCHYAFRTWRDMTRGAWNLHGHSHGRLKPQPRQADVGVDVWHFRPVTLAQVMAER